MFKFISFSVLSMRSLVLLQLLLVSFVLSNLFFNLPIHVGQQMQTTSNLIRHCSFTTIFVYIGSSGIAPTLVWECYINFFRFDEFK